MIPEDFRDFFVSSTVAVQQEIVSSLLLLSTQECDLIDKNDQKAVSCPHCVSNKIRANGRLKGVQRYVCNDCKKNFSETTGKFWFSLKKKDKVHQYLYCLLSGFSIRKSAKETGGSIQTSFDWRHKLLTSFWLRKFMESFNGVATKYLQNYLNWFLVLEKIKNSTNRMATVATIAFASNTTWTEFKNIAVNHMLFGT